MSAVVYRGWISEHTHGEADDVLFLTEVTEPLAEAIRDDMDSHGEFLTVRYFISDRAATHEELNEELVRTITGAGEARFSHRYSEVTGYLWTDEDLMVGGHDLLEELRSHVGQFCHLEITYTPASGGSPRA